MRHPLARLAWLARLARLVVLTVLAVSAVHALLARGVAAGSVRGRAAPATENTADEPDPQRLALGRLQCSCHLVKNSIKAVPMSFLSTRAQAKSAGGLAGPSGRPDRLECSCSTRPAGAKTHLPAKKKKTPEGGGGGDTKPASELALPQA